MKTDVDFILFSVKQAKEAEAYGFSRNHCSRNLKTALDHHWQRRTLRLDQKSRIPRSKAAQNLPLSECVVEHVVPKMAIVNCLMQMKPLSKAAITELLTYYFAIMLVTREEPVRLNGSGLRSTMPEDWDGSDIFARYLAVGIVVPPTVLRTRRFT
ncbi:MAG TPA: hypothetical protein VGM65_15135 [Candidatus Udaeobacter sp.]